MKQDLVQLSKTMSYALRHHPEEFGLHLDEEGWVSMQDFLAALRTRQRKWHDIDEQTIVAVMANSEKQRFELREGKIRAYYGHSVPTKVQKEAMVPPQYLYHGTTPRALEAIKREGLKPMGRQYVHLSADEETARQVALRRTSKPVILLIEAEHAHRQGIAFYLGNDMVWLADAIPPTYIRFHL